MVVLQAVYDLDEENKHLAGSAKRFLNGKSGSLAIICDVLGIGCTKIISDFLLYGSARFKEKFLNNLNERVD